MNCHTQAFKNKIAGPLKKRKKVAGDRLYIDKENPLFLWFDQRRGTDREIEGVKDAWDAIPEDLREFSCLAAWLRERAEIKGKIPRRSNLENYLEHKSFMDECDRLGIPFFIFTEAYYSATGEGDSLLCRSDETPYTDEDCDRFYAHPCFCGFIHMELAGMGLIQDEIDRMKTSIRAAKRHGGKMILFDGSMYFTPACEVFGADFDKEFYDLCTENSECVIFLDKLNGRGTRFLSPSAKLGSWLSNVCGNWGIAFENWSWVEEGLTRLYDDTYMPPRSQPPLPDGTSYEWHILQMPAVQAAFDLLQRISFGPTVFCLHEWPWFWVSDRTDPVSMTGAFRNLMYPLFQKILYDDDFLKTKESVVSKIKLAYQTTESGDLKYIQHYEDVHEVGGRDEALFGREADMFIDTYGPSTERLEMFEKTGISGIAGTWTASCGRYGIIPLLTHRADASALLPDTYIMKKEFYKKNLYRNKDKKLDFFNKHYKETSRGDLWVYIEGDYAFALNPAHNEKCIKKSVFAFKQYIVTLTLSQFGFVILKECGDRLTIETNNLIQDTELAHNDMNGFLLDLVTREDFDYPEHYRTDCIEITGFSKEPSLLIEKCGNAKAEAAYKDGALSLDLTHNGICNVCVEYVS